MWAGWADAHPEKMRQWGRVCLYAKMREKGVGVLLPAVVEYIVVTFNARLFFFPIDRIVGEFLV